MRHFDKCVNQSEIRGHAIHIDFVISTRIGIHGRIVTVPHVALLRHWIVDITGVRVGRRPSASLFVERAYALERVDAIVEAVCAPFRKDGAESDRRWYLTAILITGATHK